jgi:hypothetical protein
MTPATSISKTGLNDDNVIFAANESEVERLDKQHKVVYAAMPRLVLAPIDLSKGDYQVLDQATGSGMYFTHNGLKFVDNRRDLDPRRTPVGRQSLEYVGRYRH